MFTSDAILTAVSLATFGCLGWAIQLSSRLSVVETEYDGLKDLINQRFGEVNRRLGRIESALNGDLQ